MLPIASSEMFALNQKLNDATNLADARGREVADHKKTVVSLEQELQSLRAAYSEDRAKADLSRHQLAAAPVASSEMLALKRKLNDATNLADARGREVADHKKIVVSLEQELQSLSAVFSDDRAKADKENLKLIDKVHNLTLEFAKKEDKLCQILRTAMALLRRLERTETGDKLCQILRTAMALLRQECPKTEVLLFVRATSLQAAVLRSVMEHAKQKEWCFPSMVVLQLALLHPAAVGGALRPDVGVRTAYTAVCQEVAKATFPVGWTPCASDSGKLAVLQALLGQFRDQGHKSVVVSSSAHALNVVNQLLSGGFSFSRIDGSVPASERTSIADQFNDPNSPVSILLLSCTAQWVGGLVGGSRLVFLDMQWDPANDLQAVARMCREGQTKPCRIYRLVTAGTLEEQILQRQLIGLNMSDKMQDAKGGIDLIKSYRDDIRCLTFTSDDTVEEQLAALTAEDPCLSGACITFAKTLTFQQRRQ